MKLVTFRVAGASHAGVLMGDEIIDLAHSLLQPRFGNMAISVDSLLAGGNQSMGVVQRLLDELSSGTGSLLIQLRERGALSTFAAAHLLSPLPRPTLILAGGRAYRTHLTEMQGSKTLMPEHPHAFLKNGNTVIGPGEAIRLPSQCPDMVDYEGEFSIVVGRWCHNVSPREAKECIGGYTLINDVSARNWNLRAAGTPTDWEFVHMGKQLPTFCPMGPVMVTADEIPDPDNVRLVTRLNGKVMQDANTDDLVFPVAEMISYFSRWYPFAPGDVITTGTPSGVGFARTPRVFLAPGDVITVWSERIGELSNPVAAVSLISAP